jgi:hypothetical protein
LLKLFLKGGGSGICIMLVRERFKNGIIVDVLEGLKRFINDW